MSDGASDNEEEPQGRSYVWRLTKPELEAELNRYNIPFEPTTRVPDMKRILSNYLKQARSARASQASDEAELPTYVEPNIEIRRNDENDIQSAPVSRPASRPVTPVRPYAPTITLEAVRAELLNFREQMFDDFQNRFIIRDNLEQPQVEPEREIPRPRHTQQRIEDDLFVTSQVRRWDATFDGEKNIFTFLERIEEIRESVHLTDKQLLDCIPIVLKGKALQWYRNNKKDWHKWAEFVKDLRGFFLPGDIGMQLEEEIKYRTQSGKETAKDFIIAIQILMRRAATMSERQQVDRIHLNLRPEYRYYIRRHEIKTVSDLIRMADDYERLLSQEKTFKAPPPAHQSIMPETAYVKARSSNEHAVNAIIYRINEWNAAGDAVKEVTGDQSVEIALNHFVVGVGKRMYIHGNVHAQSLKTRFNHVRMQ